MAQKNRISATLSPQQVNNIKQALQTIKANLPQTVQLTPEERRDIPKMADKTVAFVSKSLAYAKDNPNLIPPYLNVAEFEKDMILVNQLQNILRPLHSLVEEITDTSMLAGSECYAAALVFYKSVKTATQLDMPGTTHIYQDLKKRHTRGPNNTNPPIVEDEVEESL